MPECSGSARPVQDPAAAAAAAAAAGACQPGFAHLPALHACLIQPVNKLEGLSTKLSNAIGPRQGGGVQNDASAPALVPVRHVGVLTVCCTQARPNCWRSFGGCLGLCAQGYSWPSAADTPLHLSGVLLLHRCQHLLSVRLLLE
jgi:hypothetical protein